jgi:hypothetical protein
MPAGNHRPEGRLPRRLRGVVPVGVGSRAGSEAKSKGGEKRRGIKARGLDLDLVRLASRCFLILASRGGGDLDQSFLIHGQ